MKKHATKNEQFTSNFIVLNTSMSTLFQGPTLKQVGNPTSSLEFDKVRRIRCDEVVNLKWYNQILTRLESTTT